MRELEWLARQRCGEKKPSLGDGETFSVKPDNVLGRSLAKMIYARQSWIDSSQGRVSWET